MDEIARCYRVLGLEPGTPLEEVKSAYRDLVNVWHPDRFSHNERLRAKAQEQLKEINRAYDYLLAHIGEWNVPQTQAESHETSPQTAPHAEAKDEGEPQQQEASAPPRKVFRNLVFLAVGLVLLTGGILWWQSRHRSNSLSEAGAAVKGGYSSVETNVAQ